MKLTLPIAVAVAASWLQTVPPPQASQKPADVSYETFCAKDRRGKQDLMRSMTAEQKARMWQTQIERWRDANRARLTADQLALLAEFHAMIPIGVARPLTPENDAKIEALEARLTAAFTRDEMRAMDNYGPCLPKSDRKLFASQSLHRVD